MNQLEHAPDSRRKHPIWGETEGLFEVAQRRLSFSNPVIEYSKIVMDLRRRRHLLRCAEVDSNRFSVFVQLFIAPGEQTPVLCLWPEATHLLQVGDGFSKLTQLEMTKTLQVLAPRMGGVELEKLPQVDDSMVK